MPSDQWGLPNLCIDVQAGWLSEAISSWFQYEAEEEEGERVKNSGT